MCFRETFSDLIRPSRCGQWLLSSCGGGLLSSCGGGSSRVVAGVSGPLKLWVSLSLGCGWLCEEVSTFGARGSSLIMGCFSLVCFQ